MESIPLQGHVDDQHRLTVDVPGSIPPGPVKVWIASAESKNSAEDQAGAAWATGVARDWVEELSDTRQDIYSMADGDALDES